MLGLKLIHVSKRGPWTEWLTFCRQHFQYIFQRTFHHFVYTFTVKFVLNVYLGYIHTCFGTASPMYVIPYHRGAYNLCLAQNISHISGIRSCDIICGFNGCCSLLYHNIKRCWCFFNQKIVIKKLFIVWLMWASKTTVGCWQSNPWPIVRSHWPSWIVSCDQWR